MKFEKPPPAFGLSELKAQLCNKEVEMDDDGKVWKWEVWPHPYSNDFDCFVTDSDDEAREAISILAEMYLWDGNDGGERTVKVVHNACVRAQHALPAARGAC